MLQKLAESSYTESKIQSQLSNTKALFNGKLDSSNEQKIKIKELNIHAEIEDYSYSIKPTNAMHEEKLDNVFKGEVDKMK